jgi:hypothetical protein
VSTRTPDMQFPQHQNDACPAPVPLEWVKIMDGN